MPSLSQRRERFLSALAALLLMVAAGFVGWSTSSLAQPLREKGAKAALSVRIPWTNSRLIGSPDPPPPFKVVRAFPDLKFQHPLLMAGCPGSDRLFVGEQAGVLYSFPAKPDAKADLFFDLRKEIKTIHLHPQAKEVEAVYGLVFHPDFEKNRQCFICYTLRINQRIPNLKDGTRVSRFTVARSVPPRIDPSSEEILITFLQGGHNGGDLHFGPDGMLYITTGDAAAPNPPDPFETGQDISDLLSSILRIDVDHKDRGKNYAIPRDNPFVAIKGARPEVWAYGFRNPWRMCFDRRTRELFVGDVGWELWEMVHRVEKGGNYGWAAVEGPQPIKPEKVGPTPIRPALIELPHTIACSVTGGRVYYGKKFPELRGAYIFGDWETRRLWAARFDGDRVKEMPEITRPSVRIVSFGEDKDGELYFLDYDGGTIHTIERNDVVAKNNDFPTRLSQTGLFSSVKDHVPAPGVVRFQLISRQWQDGATAEHWAAFPGTSSATLYKYGKPIPGNVDWHNFRLHFPKDGVLMKTICLCGRRIETQILHFDGVDWHPYSFAWRDDQSDADLVAADGMEKEVPDRKQKRTWQFHSRSQCMSCHNSWSQYALAFQPEQLNRPGFDGRNQLIAFTASGLIRRAGNDAKPLPPFDSGTVAQEKKLSDPADASQTLEARAQAYLHANCGHCHCEGGGGAVNLRLRFPVAVAAMNAVGVRPTRGDFALPEPSIVKPGDPYGSTLYFRIAKFGRDRMPHIGSDQPDEAGLKLIEEWIAGMSETAKKMAPRGDGESARELLANPRSSLLAARRLARGELKPRARDQVLEEAAKLPAGSIRDLFEGYLPPEKSGPRKLGSNPRLRSILALKGNTERGEQLFWSQATNCGSCHKIGERGQAVGPDLSTIGKLRSREDLLISILEPSRRIEPKYAAYIVHTADGRSYTGLLVRRDADSLVLRDSQNKEIILAAKNVEEAQPSRTSLMPAGQLAGLTAQEAADLIEYLATRK